MGTFFAGPTFERHVADVQLACCCGYRMSLGRAIVFLAAVALGAISTLLIVNLTPEARLVRRVVPHEFAASDARFLRTMSAFSNGSISSGNAVQTLVNGDEIFPSMLAEISAARSTINFETYIYWSGTVGYDFARRSPRNLAKASKSGY